MKDFLVITGGNKYSTFRRESINIETEEKDKVVFIGQCIIFCFSCQEPRVCWWQINYWQPTIEKTIHQKKLSLWTKSTKCLNLLALNFEIFISSWYFLERYLGKKQKDQDQLFWKV